MGKHSAIEWTDHTFNPWWGCTKVSPACRNCYAETWSRRVGLSLWGENASRRFFSDKHWEEPLLWNNAARREGIRRRVFCASMADVFEARPELEPWRARLWNLIEQASSLDWLLLTKRPENVLPMVPWQRVWPENVWLGITAEDQEWAEKRLPHLKDIPAAIRFISCEPLLGPLDLSSWIRHIDWIIVGGESGRSARPMDPQWVSSILNQATNAGIAFYFKQWGEWTPSKNGMKKVGKKAAGRLFRDRIWEDLPLFLMFFLFHVCVVP